MKAIGHPLKNLTFNCMKFKPIFKNLFCCYSGKTILNQGIMANLPPTTFVGSISEAKSFSKPSFPKPINQRTPRRSSSRSIKRKKFDDELVESSLKKSSKRVVDQVGPLSLEKDRKVMHVSWQIFAGIHNGTGTVPSCLSLRGVRSHVHASAHASSFWGVWLIARLNCL